jgi:hypothetical protein
LPPLQAPPSEYRIFHREEGGSLAYHESWLQRRDGFSPGRTERKKLDSEEITAQRLRDFGFDVELNQAASDAQPRDTDAFVGGVPAQFKATTGTSGRTWKTRLRSHQADLIVLEARDSVREYPRAIGRIQEWVRAHPGKELLLILAYNDPAEAYRVRTDRLEPI